MIPWLGAALFEGRKISVLEDVQTLKALAPYDVPRSAADALRFSQRCFGPEVSRLWQCLCDHVKVNLVTDGAGYCGPLRGYQIGSAPRIEVSYPVSIVFWIEPFEGWFVVRWKVAFQCGRLALSADTPRREVREAFQAVALDLRERVTRMGGNIVPTCPAQPPPPASEWG